MKDTYTEYLKTFGLTGAEALTYEVLLKNGASTGYEVAKETGISRSNVYSALAGLVEKGAAYVMEGEAVKYTPVEIKKFTASVIKDLEKKAKFLEENAPSPLRKADGYITIEGTAHIKNKIHEMLSECKLRVYVLAQKSLIDEFREDLELLTKEKKKVVLLTEKTDIDGAIIYETVPEKGQIRMITDSEFVLTGNVGGKDDTCLYSGQQNLVAVMKEALKNRIILLENDKDLN